MTGVGPVIAWRRASARNLRRSFTVPLALGFVTGVVDLRRRVAQLLRRRVLLARELRARDHLHGVLSRHARAPGAHGRAGAARAREPGRQEPPPLRRLRHPRRDRDGLHRDRGVVRLPSRGAGDDPARATRCRSAPSRSPTRTSASRTAPHYSSMLAEIEVQKNGTLGRDDVPGEALLQEAAAADDRGRACAARSSRISTSCSAATTTSRGS